MDYNSRHARLSARSSKKPGLRKKYVPQTARALSQHKKDQASELRKERLKYGKMTGDAILSGESRWLKGERLDGMANKLAHRSFHLCRMDSLTDFQLPKKYQHTKQHSSGGLNYWDAAFAQSLKMPTRQLPVLKPPQRKLSKYEDEEPAIRVDKQERKRKEKLRKINRMVEDGDTDVMSLIDHEQLNAIKAEFVAAEKPLPLEEFVDVFTRFVPHDLGLGEVKLAASLCNFFSDVDVNGDGSMEWNEFTNFIIDAGVNKAQGTMDIVDTYQPSQLEDNTPHVNPIDRVVYFDQLDHLLVIEVHGHAFRILQGKTLAQIAHVRGHTSDVLFAEYIPDKRWVSTCSNDSTIRFWDPFNGYKEIKQSVLPTIHTKLTQLSMRYSPQQQLLYTGSNDSTINVIRFRKEHSKSYIPELMSPFVGHKDVVLDMLMLPSHHSLISASMDHSIGMWDVHKGMQVRSITGHGKGVHSLAYHHTHHCLISAGFEHNAYVWDPTTDSKNNRKNLICKLKGHYNPLIGVHVIPDSPQIITADRGGLMKVWDIRNFGCVQTIHVEESDRETQQRVCSSFIAMPSHRRLVSASQKLHVHDSLTSEVKRNPLITDSHPTLTAVFNMHNNTFITTSGTTAKIWSGVDGTLQHLYHDINPTEITAMCLDDAHKKFIVGDDLGRIRVCNYLNGSVMKKTAVKFNMIKKSDEEASTAEEAFFKHKNAVRDARKKKEIVSLHFLPSVKQIVAATADGTVLLYDETKEETIPLIKKIKHHGYRDELTCSTCSHNLTLFASASAQGEIVLWDYRSHVPGGELKGHTAEVTFLCFLDPYPLLLSADGEGNVCVWVVRPILINVGRCILRFVNMTTGHASVEKRPAPITSVVFDASNGMLVTGDTQGTLKVWDFSGALKRWGFEKFRSFDRYGDIPSELEEKKDAETLAAEKAYNENPKTRSIEYEEYRRRHVKLVTQLEANGRKGNGVSMLKQGDIRLKKAWHAHNDTVRDMQLVCDPPGVVRAITTCSFDKKASVWDIKTGTSLGNFQQGRLVPGATFEPAWTFRADIVGRRARAQEKALIVLERLQLAKMEAKTYIGRNKKYNHQENSVSQMTRGELRRRQNEKTLGRFEFTQHNDMFNSSDDEQLDEGLEKIFITQMKSATKKLSKERDFSLVRKPKRPKSLRRRPMRGHHFNTEAPKLKDDVNDPHAKRITGLRGLDAIQT